MGIRCPIEISPAIFAIPALKIIGECRSQLTT
jgi:hypothetical protein